MLCVLEKNPLLKRTWWPYFPSFVNKSEWFSASAQPSHPNSNPIFAPGHLCIELKLDQRLAHVSIENFIFFSQILFSSVFFAFLFCKRNKGKRETVPPLFMYNTYAMIMHYLSRAGAGRNEWYTMWIYVRQIIRCVVLRHISVTVCNLIRTHEKQCITSDTLKRCIHMYQFSVHC